MNWLPDLITLDDYNRSITEYIEVLHNNFIDDFFSGKKLEMFNKPVKVADKTIDFDGKNERFWHIITDPHNPSYINVKEKRAERLCWIRPIIENCKDDKVLIYRRVKNHENRIFLFIPSYEYMIILTEQKKSFYLVTSFNIEYTYKLKQYQKEYKKYK